MYLSAYFEKHRDEYIDRMVAVSKRGEWREWVNFFVSGVREQAMDTVERMRHLQDLRESWRKRVTLSRTSVMALQLVDELFETPIVTIPQVRDRLSISYTTAKRLVGRLMEQEILQPRRTGTYNQDFSAPEILEILQLG